VSAYQKLTERLLNQPATWLVTGVAGFIGSNLLEELLRLNQRVVGLDNMCAGSRANLEQVRELVGSHLWQNFTHIDGDIRDKETCVTACKNVNYVLHQAALGSVPRSIENPGETHETNVTGFLNMILAARDQGVKRFVYASSSAVYGDHPELPKREANIGGCLSPYGASKFANEIYAEVFARCYGMETMGLRYFNVFGPRQDPEGAYAAVIPKWIAAMIQREPIFINGDGETTRDFCYVSNVVQANLLAATVDHSGAVNQIYNVALHSRTSLNELFALLRGQLSPFYPHLKEYRAQYRDFRAGDVRHSEADISKAQRLLGYQPTHSIAQGLSTALDWYRQGFKRTRSADGSRK
jgi:UDP-N-acetylglucosamine 4-epimerase